MVVLYEPLKALGLPSWSLVGFIVVDNMGEVIGGQESGGTIGCGGEGVGEQKADTVAQKTVCMFACFVLNYPNPDKP